MQELMEITKEPVVIASDERNTEQYGGLVKKGDVGPEVTKVQEALVDRGISVVGEVDGAFGGKTEAGIQEFQGTVGLPRTGVMDFKTNEALLGAGPSVDVEGTEVLLDFSSFGTLGPNQNKVKPVSLEKIEAATTPEAVTEAVAKATPVVAADNPLEYIFNKGFIGLDEKKTEHQGTIAGFLNNAVPNFVTKDSQVTQDSKAWCGAFVDHVLENLGVARLVDTGDKYDKLRAAQYLGYGEDVGGLDNAQAGDLVVIRNPDGWHVSFYVGKNEKGEVLALGGNQGNSVKVSAYSTGKVKGVRRIADVGSMDVDMLKDISSDIAETSGEESSR